MPTDRDRESPRDRAPVAIDIDSEPLRDQLTARLDDVGLEVTIISAHVIDPEDYPVVVTSELPQPMASTSVVVYLADDDAEIVARLRTGQWLRLADLEEVVGFIRELVP